MLKELIFPVTIISLITFIGSLVLIPVVIIHLDPNYFKKDHEPMYQYKHPVIRYTVLILKNILGYILLLLGLIMLITPGQGLLSITLGIFLINFPGKKKLEYRFFSNKKISGIINAIRRKAGKDEIIF